MLGARQRSGLNIQKGSQPINWWSNGISMTVILGWLGIEAKQSQYLF